VARFSYVARRPDGERVADYREAPDARAVAGALRADGLFPIAIRQVGGRAALAGVKRKRGGGGKPRLTDVATFVRQLGVMLQAGVGLATALEDLAAQMEKRRFAAVLESVRDRVMGGASLSAAFGEHSKVFPPLVCAMIRAGEESGNLQEVMVDLATYLDSQVSLRRTVRSAMVYPTFVLMVFCGFVAMVFLVLMPKFQVLFAGQEEKLPLLTQVVFAACMWARHWFLLLAVIGGWCGIAVRFALHSRRVQDALDRFKIGLPLLGHVILKVVLVRVLETLAIMERSGVSILMSLDIAGDTAGNKMVGDELRRARDEVVKGSFLSRELAKSGVFPRMMIRMVSVGEETGRMDELLSRMAQFYREEVEADIKWLTSLIEPVFILLMGVVVAIVISSIWLAIFELATTLRA